MRFLFSALFVLTAVPAMAAESSSTSSIQQSATEQAEFKTIHVEDLAKLLDAHDSKLAVYDANPPATRVKEGIIPGAKLLSSFKDFDVRKEMPSAKDAKLVFYCANTH